MAEIKVDIALKDGNKLTVNKSAINSISSLTQSNTDPSTIFYGVVSSTGDIEISDKQGNIKQLVENGLIDTSGVNVDIYANGNQVQSHITADSGYQDNLLNFNLTDISSNYANAKYLNIDESDYLSDVSALNVLNAICVLSKPKLDMPTYGTDTLKMYQYLLSIKLKDIDLKLGEKSSLELLNEFCSVTQTNIILNNKGENQLVVARPVCETYENSSLVKKGIFIPKKYIFESSQTSLFLKNKIKEVGINVSKSSIVEEDVVNLESDAKNQEQFNNKAFFKSNEITIGQNFGDNVVYEDDNYYILLTSVESEDYVKIKPSQYTMSYYTPNYNDPNLGKAYYVKDSNDSPFTIKNYYSIESFISDANTFYNGLIAFTNKYPILCGFFNSDMETFRKKYHVVYAIKKSMISNYNGIRFIFYILPTPYSGSGDIPLATKFKLTKSTAEHRFATDGESVKPNEVYNFEENQLLTEGSTITIDGVEIPLYQYLAQNILNDYKNGIKTKTIKIACADYYSTQSPNSKLIDWQKGKIFDIGQFVNIETEKNTDGRYINWKVTGREFIFDGVPMLKLELQEGVPK